MADTVTLYILYFKLRAEKWYNVIDFHIIHEKKHSSLNNAQHSRDAHAERIKIINNATR